MKRTLYHVALLLSLLSGAIKGAEELSFDWKKSEELAFAQGALRFTARLSLGDGEAMIHDTYGFFYEGPSMGGATWTFPAGTEGLLSAIMRIVDLKDGEVIEEADEFRISRKGHEITIVLHPQNSKAKAVIVVPLAQGVEFSKKVTRRVKSIRKALGIKP